MQTMRTMTAAALFLGLAAGTQAATLRTTTSLTAPVVRLSDLFDGAGTNADRVLGPGPAPGDSRAVRRRLAADVQRRPCGAGQARPHAAER